MWTWRRPIRLIPARAGKTDITASTAGWRAAHPRSRGENLPVAGEDSLDDGSSPLARGKRRPHGRNRHEGRLIPARAGKTSPGPAVIRPGGAHPRSRGENDVGDGVHCLVSGSSPLARGKRPRRPGGLPRTRLIPARAGKTRIRSSPRSLSAAHPRSRGENDTLKQAGQQAEGSSPLARGKHHASERIRSTNRLIPARAGKTFLDQIARLGRAAHPRSRGENLTVGAHSWPPCGSSPLARGKRRCAGCVASALRLIPARAGKTTRLVSRSQTMTAHPRSRGENSLRLVAACSR